MPFGEYKPRHKWITVATVRAGAGQAAFNMTLDEDGNRIPKRFKIIGIAVKPSIATIRAVRLFSKASRIADAANPDYSMIYEDTWSAFTTATLELSTIQPNLSYVDDDATDERLGTIYGTVEIQAGANNSAFMIDLQIMETVGG